MKIEFQPEFDTFTMTFAVSKNTVCLEDRNGVLYRVDPDKSQLLGITILGFSHRSKTLGAFKLAPFMKVCETDVLRRKCSGLRHSPRRRR